VDLATTLTNDYCPFHLVLISDNRLNNLSCLGFIDSIISKSHCIVNGILFLRFFLY